MAHHKSKSIPAAAALMLLASANALGSPGAIEFFFNDEGSQNQDHLRQTIIPAGFGDGEFTLELWIRPNENFPIGTTQGGEEERRNWTIDDIQPYTGNWWYEGNFLLDGHNNGSGFSLGTFSLQFYGGGRVRWLFGDASNTIPNGGLWSVGAYPASSTASLLDGSWHQLTLVRRWSGLFDAQLELWIDGSIVDSETSDVRTNMRQWWDNWNGFPGAQTGWFWGAEKQAVVGVLTQFEDYKGLLDEMRFWSRAKTAAEISTDFARPIAGNEPGLLARYAFGEGQGTSVCDLIDSNRCMTLGNSSNAAWSADGAPVTTGSDTAPPTTPGNLSGQPQSTTEVSLSWDASTDNVAVSGYVVRRDSAIIGNTPNTNYDDVGLQPSTTYSYTVAAQDVAGNNSPETAPVSATTLSAPDTEAPTIPTNLQGTAISPSRIDLTWEASTDNIGVTAYELRRDGSLIASPSGTSFSDTGLIANTSYSYTIAARDSAGNVSAEFGAIMVATLAVPDTEAPTTPTNVQGSAVSSSSVSLNWTASNDNIGVTGYEIRRSSIVVGTTASTSYRDDGLAAVTTYSYEIVAYDDAGNQSAPSQAINVTTNDAPTQPTSSGGGGGGGGGFGWPLLVVLAALGTRRHAFATFSRTNGTRN